MTAWGIGCTVFVAFSAALYVPSILQRRRHRRHQQRLRAWLLEDLRDQLAWARKDREHYRRLYGEAVGRNAYLLSRFGGETPLAMDAEAAVKARVLSADEREWERQVWS